MGGDLRGIMVRKSPRGSAILCPTLLIVILIVIIDSSRDPASYQGTSLDVPTRAGRGSGGFSRRRCVSTRGRRNVSRTARFNLDDSPQGLKLADKPLLIGTSEDVP
jgi:hypothetical protein